MFLPDSSMMYVLSTTGIGNTENKMKITLGGKYILVILNTYYLSCDTRSKTFPTKKGKDSKWGKKKRPYKSGRHFLKSKQMSGSFYPGF